MNIFYLFYCNLCFDLLSNPSFTTITSPFNSTCCSVFMNKYVLGRLPLSFRNFLQEMAPPNRTKGFVIDKVKSDYLYQFPSYFLPKIWNDVNMFQKTKLLIIASKTLYIPPLSQNTPPQLSVKIGHVQTVFPP